MIREMRPEDLDETARLEEQCFSEPWSRLLLREALESDLDKLWVILEGECLVGYCNFRVIAGEGELMRIAVRSDMRGRGYAGKLMEVLVTDASKRGVTAITLEVRVSNQPAISLYERFGFLKEAVRKRYYTNPVEDALLMWRRSS